MSFSLAVLTPLYPPSVGGVQETLQIFSEYFAAQDCKVRVYTSQLRNLDELGDAHWRPVKNFLPYQVKNGVEIIRYPAGGPAAFLLGLLADLCFKLRLPFALGVYEAFRRSTFRTNAILRDLAHFKPAVILAAPATEYVMTLALRAKALTGAKLLVKTSLHLDHIGDDEKKRVTAGLKQADLALTNTEYESRFLVEKGLDPEKVRVLGVGLRLDFNQEEAAEGARDEVLLNKHRGKKFVLFFGRKQEGKGMPELIGAVSKLRRDLPEVSLVLGGEETAYSKKELAGKIAALPWIVDCGAVSAPTKRWLFRNAAVFSMVSKVDSYGIVYCESWLSGRPVIAADNPQMRCVIQDGEDGILVPYGDEAALAGKLEQLLKNSAEADRLGANGKRKILQQFANKAVEKKLFAWASGQI